MASDFLGNAHPLVATGMALAALVLTALFANFVVKVLLLRGMHRLLAVTAYGRDPELRRHGLIERLANIMPALVISTGIVLVPGLPGFVVVVVQNVAHAFMILMGVMALAAAVNIVDTIYHRRPEARLKPILATCR